MFVPDSLALAPCVQARTAPDPDPVQVHKVSKLRL
jgi:hypothetical protein